MQIDRYKPSSLLRRQPLQHRALEKVEAILSAARELIAEEGTGSVSILRVSERARIPTASVYHWFSSSDDILAVLADQLELRVDDAVFDCFVAHIGMSRWQEVIMRAVTVAYETVTESPETVEIYRIGRRLDTESTGGPGRELEMPVGSRLSAFLESRLRPGVDGALAAQTAVRIGDRLLTWAVSEVDSDRSAAICREIGLALIRYLEPIFEQSDSDASSHRAG